MLSFIIGFIVILVGGAITTLKNMKVNGKDDIPYIKWKIKVMFETTNQDMSGQFTYSISNDSRARFMKFMPMCGGSPHQPSFIGRDLENYDPDLHKPIVHHDSKRLTPMDDE